MKQVRLTDFEKTIIKDAIVLNKTIVLPEAGYSKTVFDAGMLALKLKIANVIFLVKNDDDLLKFGFSEIKNKVNENLKVININNSELLPLLISGLVVKRKDKGITKTEAKKLLENEIYFATMMMELGFADGMVCGAENTTANSIRPALQIIKGKTPDSIISSFFVMVSKNKSFGDNGIFVLSDCAINENPTSDELVQIVNDTVTSAKTVARLNPRVALLTYSTHNSADGAHPKKMREVKEKIMALKPEFVVDGELQFDAGIIPEVALKKAPESKIKGNANVLIFPDLSSGNISYKIMQRLAGFTAIGPICQGFNKPINDVSRGASSHEILLTIAITCLQAK